MPDSLSELRALERQVEREWWWLNGALHAVAEVQAARSQGSLVNIRELNDRFRAYLKSTGYHRGAGLLLVTRGVAARGDDFVTRAIDATCAFDNFTDQNDPYREHDFGNFELDGETVFWKIDYYDRENLRRRVR